MSVFRNQYLVCVKPEFAIPEDFRIVEFQRFSILAEEHLEVAIAEDEDMAVALIGFAVDPARPSADNRQIAEWLGNSPNSDALEDRVSVLSGRFVVLYGDAKNQLALTDPCALRQLLYHFDAKGHPQMTSSLGLFLALNRTELLSDLDILELTASPTVQKQEMTLYGDSTLDCRLKRLLPNHRLDLNSQLVSRLPLKLPTSKTEDDLLELISQQLRGTYEALQFREMTLLQGLTAGWDSRLLCAASRPISDHIKYFVFPGSGTTDEEIPPLLSRHLGISFEMYRPEPLRPDFLEKFREKGPNHRILEKTSHIQFHYDNNHSSDYLIINGNGGEISRNYYGDVHRVVSVDHLIVLAHYGRYKQFFKRELSVWYSEALSVSEESGISICDLFYWEQRMANWGALFPEEQDLAIDEFSPLNNRNMILSFLAVPSTHRRFPDYEFHKRLIATLWPEALEYPINPDAGGLLSKVKNKYKNTPPFLWIRSLKP